uniref:Uncharacterized protein n=1 Tax=Zea mays TaxID=4577 RepID=B4FCB0_MAIZE|nr:unknown [Zea mays]
MVLFEKRFRSSAWCCLKRIIYGMEVIGTVQGIS